MTYSLVDNNRNVPITSFSEFADSVFAELSSQYNEWNGYSEGVYFCVDNIDSWKNTLIPLATRLYKLTQTDDMIYWWLLRLMSQVDICKDRKEDFRKKDVFDVLLQLNLKHRTIILENTVQNHAEELQKALDENALDAFRSMLPIIDDDETIYKIGRVLKRAIDVRDIFERTMTHTEGDALGILFVLFRRYYYYFANAYNENHRACDGMAKNVFLALYQTQYRENKINFCDIADNIGNLWIRSLILANHNTQMPLAVRELLSDVLHGQNTSDMHGKLYEEFKNCDTEEQKEKYGGWLKLERYGFVYRFLEEEHIKIKPPFSCKCTDVRHIRRVRRPVQRNDCMEHCNVQDNCVPYIDSENAIPMEELRAIATSEDVQNKQGVLEQSCEIISLPIPGHIKLFKDNDCVGEYEDISLSLESKPVFLKELAVVLSNNNYFSRNDQENFVCAFGGTPASSESHSMINWMETSASLVALCYVLFDEEITGDWPKIASLFWVQGKSLDTSNASKYKKGTYRRKMQNHVKEALKKIDVTFEQQ